MKINKWIALYILGAGAAYYFWKNKKAPAQKQLPGGSPHVIVQTQAAVDAARGLNPGALFVPQSQEQQNAPAYDPNAPLLIQ